MKKHIRKIVLMLVLLTIVFIVPNAKAINVGDTVSYTSEYHNHQARIFKGAGLEGTCIDPGVDARESGTATVQAVADSSSALARIGYYVCKHDSLHNNKNLTTILPSAPDADTIAYFYENLLQIANAGSQRWGDAAQTPEGGYNTQAYVNFVVNYYNQNLSSFPNAPGNFKLYRMNAGSGNQNFALWDCEPFEATKSYASNTAAGESNAAVKKGDVITYQIKWNNSNGSVKIEDTLSSGLEYVAGSSNKGEPTISGQKLTWTGLTGETGTLTYKVKVTTDSGKVCNNAKATSGDESVNLKDLCNPIPKKSYAGSSTSDNDGYNHAAVTTGKDIKYKIVLPNVKDSAVTVVVTDTLSTGLSYNNNAAVSGGTLSSKSASGQNLTFNVSVPANGTATLTYSAKVTSAAGTVVKNDAKAKYGNDPAMDIGELKNPIPKKSYGGTSLSDNKGWDHHEVLMPDERTGRVGDDIKYKVVLPNVKDSAVTVVVTDVLSKGLTLNNDGAVSGGTLSNKTSTVNSQTKITTAVFTVSVPANGTATLTYSAKVNKDAVNLVNNNAKAKYGNDPAIDIGSLANPVPKKAYDVDTAAGMNGKIVQNADIITYNIGYANPYTEKATINLRDTLSKGLKYKKGTAKVCDHNKENCKSLTESGIKETVTVLNDGKTQILWTRTNMDAKKAEIIVYSVEVEGEVIKVQNDFDIKTCRTTASTTKTETVANCKEQPNPNCEPNCSTGSSSTSGSTSTSGDTNSNCKPATDKECTESKQTCTFEDTVCNGTWMDVDELKNPKPEKMYNEKTPAGYNHAAVSERDRIRYEIRYENVEKDPIDIKIKDTISKGIEFIKTTFKVNNTAIPAGEITFTDNNKTFTWTDKNVEPNKTRSLTYEVVVTGETTKVKNKACIEFSNNPGYERCLKELENPVPQKTYAKDTPAGANGAQVKKGDTIRYSIKYSNSKDVSSNVIIMDNLSKGIEYIPGTAKVNGKKLDPVSSTKDSNGQMLVWMKEIASGADEELTYDVKVTGETLLVENNASIQYDDDPVIKLDELRNPLVQNPSLVNIPNTASVITITGIVLGVSLIGGGSYLIYRRYKKA